jgi:hypothetical protein
MTDDRTSYQWVKDVHVPTPADHPAWIPDVKPAGADGEHSVRVFEVTLGDPADQVTLPDGAVVTVGVPLREIRNSLGGDVGYWKHPISGQPIEVSIKKWKNKDPDTTLLRLEFITKPPTTITSTSRTPRPRLRR